MTNLIDIFKRRLLINSVFEGLFNSKKDLNILLTDGTDPITPVNVTVVGGDVEIEVDLPKDLSLQFVYAENDDVVEYTLILSNNGTINNIVTTENITNIEINGTAVNVPFAVEDGDEITIEFDAVTSDGVIILNGNYV